MMMMMVNQGLQQAPSTHYKHNATDAVLTSRMGAPPPWLKEIEAQI
jgi:hypothetical protein